jgi:hypothetical protein
MTDIPKKIPVYSSMHQIKQGDRLFAPINDLLIIIAAIAHASSFMVGGKTHTHKSPNMRVHTRFGYGFGLPLRGPLESALHNVLPGMIEIGVITDAEHLDKPLLDVKLETAGLHNTMATVTTPIFLMFFERYSDWLTLTYGDAAGWPATLNFARVIRNAAAHGKINIRNKEAVPVTWRGMQYGPADNGRQIIGTDLKLGEIIALMLDANEELDKLSVPVL